MAENTSPGDARLRVLVVDDDPNVLETTEALLSEDFDVVAVGSAYDALRALRRDPAAFDVLCTDYKMPQMNGLELLQRVDDLGIYVARVLMTGHQEAYLSERAEGWSLPLSLVIKPYDIGELTKLIARMGRLARVRRATREAVRVTGS